MGPAQRRHTNLNEWQFVINGTLRVRRCRCSTLLLHVDKRAQDCSCSHVMLQSLRGPCNRVLCCR